jgi:ferrous iron transport protein B
MSQSHSPTQKLVILAGNPNSGKSTLFNLLTGLNQRVGNYPGVTVDKKTGSLALPSGNEVKILDLPGAYSLYPTSKDERIVVRQFLSEARQPDLIVYVADVSQLEKQSLFLTQIRDLGYPLVLALNMVDLEGISVQPQQLAAHFGVPVIPLSGKTGFGLEALKAEISSKLDHPSEFAEPYYKLTPLEKELTDKAAAVIKESTAYGALLTMHHYTWLEHLTPQQKTQLGAIATESKFNAVQHQISETLTRYTRFTPVIRKALHLEAGGAGMRMTDRIDKWVMHPVLGSVIFFLIMLLIFQAIFAWATFPMDWIEAAMGGLSGLVRDIFPGGWITDLICDGFIAGLTGILVFIPQIAILFFFVGILEEVGYMARVVSMFDVMLRRFGLNGRSIVALVSGGACAIPAIMSTRNISNWKERLITIMVTPFISCSARIPVYAILIGFAVPSGKLWGFEQQGLALMALYGIGIAAALFAAYVLKHIVQSHDRSFLMMELPIYRPPMGKNLFFLVFEKTKSFVVGAGKIILVISLILWFLASFGPGIKESQGDRQFMLLEVQQGPALADSYAGIIGKGIEPVIAPLGFDWKIGIALITSFAAREVFVGTMATIYSIEDDSDVTSIRTRMAEDTDPVTGRRIYNPASTWSLLIFYVFAMQCMSTLAVVKRETNSWKWPTIQFFMMTTMAYLGSLAVYQFLS